MNPVKDWDSYRHHVGTIRRLSSAYSTNLYADQASVERWCSSGRLQVLTADRAALFLRSDRDFYHLYHVAEDEGALFNALDGLAEGTYVTDLVGKGPSFERLRATHVGAGFLAHTQLCRMGLADTGRAKVASDPDQAPEVAKLKHVPEILALLERILDRYSEQIPVLEELAEAVQYEQLLFVRCEGAIAAILLYEQKGQLAHLRLWHVESFAQGAGIGRQLMAAFHARTAASRRKILWVKADNRRSIDIYRHYGFAEDGLLDQIMILDKGKLIDE